MAVAALTLGIGLRCFLSRRCRHKRRPRNNSVESAAAAAAAAAGKKSRYKFVGIF